MAVPASPSVGSRAVYYPYAVPAPTVPAAQGGPNAFSPVPSNVPPDCGAAGVALPAVVYSLGGVTPDYSGMALLVFTPSGQVLRSASFASNQPMLNQATWVSQGSNPLQARWALVDALS
jgi:hypothetical protein